MVWYNRAVREHLFACGPYSSGQAEHDVIELLKHLACGHAIATSLDVRKT